MKIKVLFVCLGNICRSPMAESVFLKLISDLNCSDMFMVDSAGTSNYHIGSSPDQRTIAICNTYHLPCNHKGRQLTELDLIEFDYILAMDDTNYSNICALTKSKVLHNKVFRMMEFASNTTLYDYVPDPYYGDAKDFELVYRLLKDACNGLMKKIEIDYNKKFIS
jgi:protein-tyrosine phosphatase